MKTVVNGRRTWMIVAVGALVCVSAYFVLTMSSLSSHERLVKVEYDFYQSTSDGARTHPTTINDQKTLDDIAYALKRYNIHPLAAGSPVPKDICTGGASVTLQIDFQDGRHEKHYFTELSSNCTDANYTYTTNGDINGFYNYFRKLMGRN